MIGIALFLADKLTGRRVEIRDLAFMLLFASAGG
jgi:hypothetical protein